MVHLTTVIATWFSSAVQRGVSKSEAREAYNGLRNEGDNFLSDIKDKDIFGEDLILEAKNNRFRRYVFGGIVTCIIL